MNADVPEVSLGSASINIWIVATGLAVVILMLVAWYQLPLDTFLNKLLTSRRNFSWSGLSASPSLRTRLALIDPQPGSARYPRPPRVT